MHGKLILIGLLVATAAFGQRGGGGGGSRGGRGGGSDMPVSFGPKNKLEQISDILQLSKDQKKDVKALMDEGQKEASPLKADLVKSRARISAAIAGGKQEEVDQAIAAHSELDARMTAIEMKAFAGVYKLLEPDQRTRSRGLFIMMPGIFKARNWTDPE